MSNSNDHSTEGANQSSASIPDFSHISTAELVAQIKRPTTPLEILENIKFVMEHELLLREDFYLKDRLGDVFGGKLIHIGNCPLSSSRWAVMGSISRFGDLLSQRNLADPKKSDLSLSFSYSFGSSPLRGEMGVMATPPPDDFIFDNLLSLFGAPTRFDEMSIALRLQYALALKQRNLLTSYRHPHTNQAMVYKSSRGDVKNSISLWLNFEGKLHDGTFVSERPI